MVASALCENVEPTELTVVQKPGPNSASVFLIFLPFKNPTAAHCYEQFKYEAPLDQALFISGPWDQHLHS